MGIGNAAFRRVHRAVGREVLGVEVRVLVAREFGWNYDATYDLDTGLVVHLMRVGHDFFNSLMEENPDRLADS